MNVSHSNETVQELMSHMIPQALSMAASTLVLGVSQLVAFLWQFHSLHYACESSVPLEPCEFFHKTLIQMQYIRHRSAFMGKPILHGVK